MIGASGEQPGQTSSEKYAPGGHHCEFGFAAGTDDDPQNEKRYCVGGQVSKGGVQEGGPNYSREAADVPGSYSILRQMATQDDIVDQKGQPASCCQSEDWGEPFDHEVVG